MGRLHDPACTLHILVILHLRAVKHDRGKACLDRADASLIGFAVVIVQYKGIPAALQADREIQVQFPFRKLEFIGRDLDNGRGFPVLRLLHNGFEHGTFCYIKSSHCKIILYGRFQYFPQIQQHFLSSCKNIPECVKSSQMSFLLWCSPHFPVPFQSPWNRLPSPLSSTGRVSLP